MADRYAKFQKTATRLIGKWKQGSVRVIRVSQTEPPLDHPSWQPWDGPTTTQVYELDAVVKGVSAKLIDGNVVIASDRELVCSHKMTLVEVDGAPVTPTAAAFDVSLLDTLNIDGRPVTVVLDLSVPPAGMPVVHRYIVRG